MRRIKRLIGSVLIGLSLLGIIVVPALAAAYYADVAAVNTSATGYTMLPMWCSLNVPYLIANGYITTPSGLDTRVEAGTCPHMLSQDKLLYARAMPAGASSLSEFTTGNVALPSGAFYTLTGYNGYISALDNAQLELGDDFIIDQKGYVDTTAGASKRLIYKDSAIQVYISAAGSITATITGISGSGTFYPDPHVEVTSVDGVLEEQTATVVWANLVGAAGDSSTDNSAIDNYLWIRSTANVNEWDGLRRSIFLFDTSSIPDGATITSATLSVYGTAKGDTFVPAIAPDINVYGSTPASNVALVAADYAQVQAVPFCDTPITYAGWNIAGYNAFTLNAAGIAAVKILAGEVSKFSLRNANYDVAVATPTWSASHNAYLSGYYADQALTINDPKLVVNYTITPTVSVTAVGIPSGVCRVVVTADTANLTIQVYDAAGGLIDDDTVLLSGATVTNNGSNFLINQNNVMPYMEYLKITSPVGGSSEKLWFQPVSYIRGQPFTDSMYPYFVAAGAVANAANGNVTPALPAGWVADDIFICLVASLDNINSTLPAGWTAIDAGTNNGAGFRMTAYYRRAVGGDVAPLVTHVAGSGISAVVVAYRGCNTTGSPIDVLGATSVNTPASVNLIFSAAGITTIVNRDCVVELGGVAGQSTSATYTGTPTPIERVDGPNVAARPEVVIADFTQVTAGATGARQSTIANFLSNGILVSLKPTGTVTFTNGITAVTGVETSWTSAMDGSIIWDNTDLISHTISAVTSATTLTLTANYTGVGGAGHYYTIAPRLPDRDTVDGYQDGAITWGVNPSGVSVSIGGMAPVISAGAEEGVPPPDVAPEINPPASEMYPGEEAMEGAAVTWLAPIVTDLASRTNTPIVEIWWLMCAVFVLLFMAAVHRFMPNLLLTGVSGLVALGLCVAMAFLPSWIIILAVLFIIGLIVMERSPSL